MAKALGQEVYGGPNVARRSLTFVIRLLLSLIITSAVNLWPLEERLASARISSSRSFIRGQVGPLNTIFTLRDDANSNEVQPRLNHGDITMAKHAVFASTRSQFRRKQ